MTDERHQAWLRAAIDEARRSMEVGGVPIGAVLVAPDGQIAGRASNRCVQDGAVLQHAEIAAVESAGLRRDYPDTVLVTTMTPCWMCAGMVRFLGIGSIVVGDDRTWPTDALDALEAAGVRVLARGDDECTRMFDDWLATDPPAWWH